MRKVWVCALAVMCVFVVFLLSEHPERILMLNTGNVFVTG